MKIKACVLFVPVAILFLSAGTKKAGLTEGYRKGDLAPRIESLENSSDIDFRNCSERYTLVNFWAAYDAESRLRNIRLWNNLSTLDSTRIDMYSVSVDENVSVFTETLKADQLESTNQLYDTRGKKSLLYKKYGLKKGLRNFLIDHRGVIIEVNLTPEKLAEIVNKEVYSSDVLKIN